MTLAPAPSPSLHITRTMTTPADELPKLIKENVFFSPKISNEHGIYLKLGEEGAILIYHIDPKSEAAKTDLCEGCEVLSINDHRVASVQKAEEMLVHYMGKKGLAKVVASKGGRPRGTKYVLVKNTSDKSIFEGEGTTIDGLELEQRDGYVRVAASPASGFFDKVRMNKNDCIWSINGVTVKDLHAVRHELKVAEGKIVYLLMYNSFRKLKTTVMANVSLKLKGDDKWTAILNSVEDKADRLEEQYDIHQKVRR
jgi:C-terminal processing protease CtpA/Prc